MPVSPSWDLVCYSHLRWNSVFQRPHHLMTRCASERRVFFIEEPIVESGVSPHLETSVQPNSTDGKASHRGQSGIRIITPLLPEGLRLMQQEALLADLISDLLIDEEVERYVAWYYTPMAMGFTRHLHPVAMIYDCMDELSAFLGASPHLLHRESALLRRAGVVFAGGQSLYEAKKNRHHNVLAFPSSIDAVHFAKARQPIAEPPDQADLPRPRIGFAGVIDERMDVDLLRAVAALRPRWQFVMLGPVVKIDPATLPRFNNIHYLGLKPYAQLPAYFSAWDVAWLPFARNEATRYISPTKTPEYLAAGCPVVSTSICDIVRPYGERDLVRIADGIPETVAAMEAAMELTEDNVERRKRADAFIAGMSWDTTWRAMLGHVEALLRHARHEEKVQRWRDPRVHIAKPASALEHPSDALA